MKKTLFILTAFCFASALSYATTEWNGHAKENYNAVTGADGSKSNVYVLYTRDKNDLTLTTDEANFDISPDLNSVTATVTRMTASTAGANFYISPNAWGYSRSFASLTIEEANLTKANLRVFNSTEGGTINANIKKIIGSLGSVVNTGTLSLGTAGEEATTTTICGTVTNSGTLALNGNISFDVSNLSGYTCIDSGSMTAPEAGQNGFESGTALYALVSGVANLNRENATIITTSGAEVTQTGDALAFSVTGNGARYYIQDGNTVTLSDIQAEGTVGAVTVVSGTLDINAAGLGLQDVAGVGNVLVSAALTMDGNAVSAATGSLTVKDVQLTIGGGDTQTSSLASFSSVILDGGTIRYNNKQDTLHNVTVASGKTGVINSYDMGRASDGAALVLEGDTRVDGTLNIRNEWNAQFSIKKLAGSGTLNIQGTDGGSASSEPVAYTIDQSDFSEGTLSVANQRATVDITSSNIGTLNAYRGTINIKSDTQVGNLNGGKNGQLDANIHVESGATLTAARVNMNWGFASFVVDGTVNSDDFVLSTGNQNYTVSGAGTINTTKLSTGNVGMYTISVARVNVGSGGVALSASGNQGFANTLANGVTMGALADWNSALAFKMGGAVTFNTENAELNPVSGIGHTITLSGVLSDVSAENAGSLVKAGNGTLVLNGANTYSGGTGVNGGTLTVSHRSGLGTGAVTVGEAGTLNINAGITLSSAIVNSGSVVFNSNITATGLTGGTRDLAPSDAPAEGPNNFLRHQEYLTVVTGSGSVTASNITVNQGDKTYTMGTNGEATITTYDYSTYYLCEGNGSVSTYAGWASSHQGTLTTVEMRSSGTLTVDANLEIVNADTQGGTVAITTGTVQNLNVNADTTVTGQVDPTVVKIAGDTSATLSGGISTSGVTISGTAGATVQNTGDSPMTYGLDQADAKVTADSLVAESTSEVTVANQLAVKSISNEGTGALVIDGTVAGVESITAESGDITLNKMNAEIQLNELSVGSKIVRVNTALADGGAAESTIEIATDGTISASTGGTLYANLTLLSGSTLNLDGVLALGSTLTLGNGIILDGTLGNSVKSLQDGASVTLIQAADNTTLAYGDSTYNGANAATYFAGLGDGYTIKADSQVFAIQKTGSDPVVPEPTTGTLSLLALAGLMARRRRK